MTRQMPFEMPSELVELSGGEIPQLIDLILARIKALPGRVRERLEREHIVQPGDLQYLPQLAAALRHLREGITPSDDELLTLNHARDIVDGVAEGLGYLLGENSLTPTEAAQCQRALAELNRINAEILPGEIQYAAIQSWAMSYRDFAYPENPSPVSLPPEP